MLNLLNMFREVVWEMELEIDALVNNIVKQFMGQW